MYIHIYIKIIHIQIVWCPKRILPRVCGVHAECIPRQAHRMYIITSRTESRHQIPLPWFNEIFLFTNGVLRQAHRMQIITSRTESRHQISSLDFIWFFCVQMVLFDKLIGFRFSCHGLSHGTKYYPLNFFLLFLIFLVQMVFYDRFIGYRLSCHGPSHVTTRIPLLLYRKVSFYAK